MKVIENNPDRENIDRQARCGKQVELRKAERDDARFIATAVLSAMGNDVYAAKDLTGIGTQIGDLAMVLDVLEKVAAREDTLYSWRNAYIATYDGEDAGVMVAYDGAEYAEKSVLTFSLISSALGEPELKPGSEEATAGEYYLDSLSAKPEFRGHGIGAILIRNALEVAEGLGFGKATLLVDKEKPWLHCMYGRLGFEITGEQTFFGEQFYRMTQYLR